LSGGRGANQLSREAWMTHGETQKVKAMCRPGEIRPVDHREAIGPLPDYRTQRSEQAITVKPCLS
jgi:hypothetical protein